MKSSMILLKALGDINDQYLNYENEERKKKIVIKLKYILVPVFMFVIVVLGIVQFNNSNLVTKNIDENNIFTIRVYGAEVENTYLTSNYIDENAGEILRPKIEVLLANYNLLMSSVPGLPLRIELNNENDLIDEIVISTDIGNILTWNMKSGEVQSKGKSFSINNTDILYWSPDIEEKNENINLYDQNIWNDDNIKTIGKINISAKKNNEKLDEKVIFIGEKDYNYYAILK